MDPDKNWEIVVERAKAMRADFENPNSNGIDQEDAYSLAELVLALDEWVKQGGFPPRIFVRQA